MCGQRPAFEKGGQGAFEAFLNPPKSPFSKGGLAALNTPYIDGYGIFLSTPLLIIQLHIFLSRSRFCCGLQGFKTEYVLRLQRAKASLNLKLMRIKTTMSCFPNIQKLVNKTTMNILLEGMVVSCPVDYRKHYREHPCARRNHYDS
jgi:hypothetical protein